MFLFIIAHAIVMSSFALLLVLERRRFSSSSLKNRLSTQLCVLLLCVSCMILLRAYYSPMCLIIGIVVIHYAYVLGWGVKEVKVRCMLERYMIIYLTITLNVALWSLALMDEPILYNPEHPINFSIEDFFPDDPSALGD